MPSFVLIHGGSFTAGYFDRLTPLLAFESLAVDLPGRGSRPAAIGEVVTQDWVDSVVTDIVAAGLDDIVVLGNSLAGITMPGVAMRLPERIRHLVFSSCTVPADGGRAVDDIRPDIRASLLSIEEAVAAGRFDASAAGQAVDPARAVADAEAFVNSADETLLRFVAEPARRQLPEALRPMFERFSYDGFPWQIPRTYISNLEDRMVPTELQRRMIRHIDATAVVELDTPHCPEISHPELIAALLNDIAAGPARLARA